jgi:hypothetical protein
MTAPYPLPVARGPRVLGNPTHVMYAPGQPRVPSQQATRIPTPAMYAANVAGIEGLGAEFDPGQVTEGFGLPPQDLINSLYDIFGSYPRKNVLPYFFSFTLLSATNNALTALGTQRPSIKITADAAMIATLFTGASTGEYSIFMRTDSSDRQLMQFPVHSASIVGTAERPFPLPKPLLLAPNTTLSFDITDLSNATNEVWFTLAGFKVYRRQYAAAG